MVSSEVNPAGKSFNKLNSIYYRCNLKVMSDLVELPVGVREGNEKLVKVSASASIKIFQLIEREGKGEFLRIRITGGGCNGLSYKMKFVMEPKEGDIYVLSESVKVLVDSKTALYLRGTLLEYSDKLVAGGFKFSNPNAKASCSCGESFNL